MLYRRYNPVLCLAIRIIAKWSGATIDTAHDREHTDWNALDRFADETVSEVLRLYR